MKVFVAGTTGAIDRPLIAELVRQGHKVTGLTRSEVGSQAIREWGADAAQVSAFDAAAVQEAVRRSGAEVIIDELTSLPKSPVDIPAVVSTSIEAQSVEPGMFYPKKDGFS